MKKHVIGAGGLLCFLCLALFFGKVFWNSRSEYGQGEKAYAQGDFKKALRHYDRAVHWYTPGSSSVKKSIERIWEIGQRWEEKGDPKSALEAYWSLRSSLYGVRSFYTPYAEWIGRSNERIASIWLKNEAYSDEEKRMSPPKRKELYLNLLQKDRAPSVKWAAVTEMGFFGWVCSALWFIFHFLRKDRKLAITKALIWGGCTIFFYLLWIVGMARA